MDAPSTIIGGTSLFRAAFDRVHLWEGRDLGNQLKVLNTRARRPQCSYSHRDLPPQGLFDQELWIERGDERFGPLQPIGGPAQSDRAAMIMLSGLAPKSRIAGQFQR
jgi:hypothetical protein